ncbi:MAG: hypothetical protein QOI66_4256 [Myxococcales bacterium]|nr:hypothetical protein [Myxococcales bacterium]
MKAAIRAIPAVDPVFPVFPVLPVSAVLAMVVGFSACASSQLRDATATVDTTVPEKLQPSNGTTLLMRLHAEGAQIYVCKETGHTEAGASKYAWVLQGPKAKLYDQSGHLAATHFAGPTWKSAVDGSAVVGKKIQDSPAPVAGAIPWLLLKTASTTGQGQFSSVVAIQRVATEGGTSPTEECAAAALGAERAVPYKAEYKFFGGGDGAAIAKKTGEATGGGW